MVIVEYENGDVRKHVGAPPIEDWTNKENPMKKMYGSPFASLLGIILNPAPDRDINDYE